MTEEPNKETPATSSLYDLWNAIEDLRGQFEYTTKRNEEYIEINSTIVEQISQHEAQINYTIQKRDKVLGDVLVQEIENEVLEWECRDLESDLKRIQDEIDKAKEDIRVRRSEIQDSVKSIEDVSHGIENAVSQEAIDRRLAMIRISIAKTEERIREKQENQAMNICEGESIEMYIRDMETEKEKMAGETNQIGQWVEERHAKIEKTKETIAKKQSDIARMTKEINTAREGNSELKKANILSQNLVEYELDELELDKKQLVQRISAMVLNLEEVESKISLETEQ